MGASLSRALSRRRSQYTSLADSETIAEVGSLDAPICGHVLADGGIDVRDCSEEFECTSDDLDNIAALGRTTIRDVPCTEEVISRVRAGEDSNLMVHVEPNLVRSEPAFPRIEPPNDGGLEMVASSRKFHPQESRIAPEQDYRNLQDQAEPLAFS